MQRLKTAIAVTGVLVAIAAMYGACRDEANPTNGVAAISLFDNL